MRKAKIIVFIVILSIGILGWVFLRELRFKKLKIDGVIINVEISDTEAKRRQGLSFREFLGEKEGMLFIFETPDYYPFWMKDMKFPLDFIWISGEEIVEVTENVPPDFPGILKPSFPVDKVLEVNAGFVKKYQIKPGQKIQILD